MRIVVTGGAGFIGSALVRHLVDEVGCEVLNLDKLTYAGTLTSLASIRRHANHRFERLDICDQAAVAAALEAFRPTHIMHLAAESHVDRSIAGAKTFIDTNVGGTLSMLEAARAYWSGLDADGRAAFRFLHVSTDEVYGSLGAEGAFEETTAYDPSSPYSASKAASDHLAIAWHRTYGLPVIVSNCSNNYGPYHFPEKLIPLVTINALEGQPLPVYGRGTQVRDWLFVEDHVRALLTVATRGRPGEKYNVGGNSERQNIDVVTSICAHLDRLAPKPHPHDRLITYVADRPGHDQRYAIDATKIRTELGWQPRETFESGLEKPCAGFLANEEWWRPLRKAVYRGERLGLAERLAG